MEKIVEPCPNCPYKKWGHEDSTADIGTPTKKADFNQTPTNTSVSTPSFSKRRRNQRPLNDNEGDMYQGRCIKWWRDKPPAIFRKLIWNKISCHGRAWSIQERPETEVRYGILQGPYWKNAEANGMSMVKKIFV